MMSSHLWRKCFCSESTGRGSGIKANSVLFHTLSCGGGGEERDSSLVGAIYCLRVSLFQLSPLLKSTQLWSLPFLTFLRITLIFFSLCIFSFPIVNLSLQCFSSSIQITAMFCQVTGNQLLQYLFHHKHSLGWGQGPKWSASLRLIQSYSEKFCVTWYDDSTSYFSKNWLGCFHFGTWLGWFSCFEITLVTLKVSWLICIV